MKLFNHIKNKIKCFEFEIIKLGWNGWNGFYFDILKIERIRIRYFEGSIFPLHVKGSIFGLHVSEIYTTIHIFYFSIDLKNPRSKYKFKKKLDL